MGGPVALWPAAVPAYTGLASTQHRLQNGIKVVFNHKVWQWSLSDQETISIDGLQELLAKFAEIQIPKRYQAFYTADGVLCTMQDLSDLLRSDRVELTLQDVRTMPPVDARAHVQMLRQTADKLERMVEDQARVIQTFQQVVPQLPDPMPAPPEADVQMQVQMPSSGPLRLVSSQPTQDGPAQEPRCPQGHQLTRTTTPGAHRTCSGCNALVPGGQQAMSCQYCGWDLCGICYLQPEALRQSYSVSHQAPQKITVDFGGDLFSWFTPSAAFIGDPDLDFRMRSNVEQHFQVPSCEQLIVDRDNKVVVTAADFKRVLQSLNPFLRISRQGKPQFALLPPPIVEGASPLSQRTTIAPYSPAEDSIVSVLRPMSPSSPRSPRSPLSPASAVGTPQTTIAYAPSTSPPTPVRIGQSPLEGVNLGSYSPSLVTRSTADKVADNLFNAWDRNRDGVISRPEFRQGTRARTPSVVDVDMGMLDYNVRVAAPAMAQDYNVVLPASAVTAARVWTPPMPPTSAADAVFNAFDQNRDGVISRAEFGGAARPSVLVPASTPVVTAPSPRVNFSVTLRRDRCTQFGIQIEPMLDGRALLVRGVLPGGVLATWNAQSPHYVVRPGALIWSVNGVVNDACRMESVLLQSDTVRLEISTCGSAQSM